MVIPTGEKGLSVALILPQHRNHRQTNPRVTVGTARRGSPPRDQALRPMVPEGLAVGLPTVLLPMEAEEAGATGVMEVIPRAVTRGRTMALILGQVGMGGEILRTHVVRPVVAKGLVDLEAVRAGLLLRHHLPLLQGAEALEVMEPRATGRNT